MQDNRNQTPDEDLWLEQQLAEAHALLGDNVPQAEEPAVPAEHIHPRQEPLAQRHGAAAFEEEQRHEAPRHTQPKKDRLVPVLVGIIVVELLAIAGVALYWVNVLT